MIITVSSIKIRIRTDIARPAGGPVLDAAIGWCTSVYLLKIIAPDDAVGDSRAAAPDHAPAAYAGGVVSNGAVDDVTSAVGHTAAVKRCSVVVYQTVADSAVADAQAAAVSLDG